MNNLFPLILLLLVVTLVFGVWGFHAFVMGIDRQRRLASRGVLDDAERKANSPMARLDARLRRTDLGRVVGRRIAASGLRIRISTFLTVLTVVALAAIIFVWKILAPVFGIAAAFGVGIVFFAFLRRQEERRKDEFIGQLPELARVLSNATSAGLAVRTALSMAADELGEPAHTELRRTADALAFGQSFDDALSDLQERLPSRELAVLVSTLVVSSRSGGSLVTALRNISGTLEERKEIRREVKTIMGEATVTSWAIAILGIGAIFLINSIEPGSVRRMTEHLVGQIALAIAAALFTGGLLAVRKMTRIDV